MCECGHGLDFQDGTALCIECGNKYRKTAKGIDRLQKEMMQPQAAENQ
jgi:hypothetical protein